MDWKRAKTILIIMLLMINSFLSYQLIEAGRNQDKYISKQELESVQRYIESKNIKLEVDIPDRVTVIPSLKVKYNEFEIENIKQLLFKNTDVKLNMLDEGYSLINGDITVEVKNNVHFFYKDEAIKIKQGEVNKRQCLINADIFIKSLNLDTSNKYVKLQEIKNGYVRIIMGQQYKNIPVENSQIEIIATEEGVSEAHINWFEWIKPDNSHNITTPVVALLKAFEDKKAGSEAIAVKQIRQGYYFNIDEQKDAKGNVPVEGTVSPMWVIVSDKNQTYINAYNEKIEKIK